MDIYDYVVIGAGSAGCVAARRLSDDPANRVLLLEAGPPAENFWIRTPAGMAQLFLNKKYNWGYFTEPIPTMKNRRIYWPRGKTLGGSSSINGMIYIRGHRLDFDHWESLGNPGWGYDDVLPSFKRMEHNESGANQYRGTGGPLWISDPVIRHPTSVDFIEAAHRTGIPRSDDLNGECHDGVSFVQHNIRRGTRQSAYVAYVKPVLSRANLTVRTGVHVRRIVFEGNVACGVEVVINGELRTIEAAREVIVSAGALNSPQILMLSGIGDGEMLQGHGIKPLFHLPGVGRNLQDHFYAHVLMRSTMSSSFNRELHGIRKIWQGLRYLTTRGGYLALGSSQAVAFAKSHPDLDYADLQISFRPMTFNFHPSGQVLVDDFPGITGSVYHLRPESRGAVVLRSADSSQAPAFIPNYIQHPDDVKAMTSGLRQIRSIFATQPLASRAIEELSPSSQIQTDEQFLGFLEANGNCAYHPVGTCKMGQDPMAVVDARLRVHGVKRLRVVDASIMPRITAGNTNAPSMMIGEKGADLIKADAIARRSIS